MLKTVQKFLYNRAVKRTKMALQRKPLPLQMTDEINEFQLDLMIQRYVANQMSPRSLVYESIIKNVAAMELINKGYKPVKQPVRQEIVCQLVFCKQSKK